MSHQLGAESRRPAQPPRAEPCFPCAPDLLVGVGRVNARAWCGHRKVGSGDYAAAAASASVLPRPLPGGGMNQAQVALGTAGDGADSDGLERAAHACPAPPHLGRVQGIAGLGSGGVKASVRLGLDPAVASCGAPA